MNWLLASSLLINLGTWLTLLLHLEQRHHRRRAYPLEIYRRIYEKGITNGRR